MNAEREGRNADQQDANGILVCFAVRNEAKHFNSSSQQVKTIFTGIGPANARKSLLRELEHGAPRLVLTCGYAGGLNPKLRHGTVVFNCQPGSRLHEQLQVQGAISGTFHCANHIAVTASSKQSLWIATHADAVEMESGVIREVCQERGIEAATIRVISDDASTDLPLDFNQLSAGDGNISYRKLAMALIASPGSIPRLIRFQSVLDNCSRRLAAALEPVVNSK